MAWPTTSNPRTEFLTLRVTADEAAALDAAVAAGLAPSRSAYVRAALTAALAEVALTGAATSSKASTSSKDRGE